MVGETGRNKYSAQNSRSTSSGFRDEAPSNELNFRGTHVGGNGAFVGDRRRCVLCTVADSNVKERGRTGTERNNVRANAGR